MKIIKRLMTLILLSFTITGCSNTLNSDDISKNEISSMDKLADLRQMVMVNEKIYYNSNYEITLARCGTLDGEITSAVNTTEVPKENNQSNFGEGYGYQVTGENTIDVLIDNKWIRFETE